jgi:hypothetical protein
MQQAWRASTTKKRPAFGKGDRGNVMKNRQIAGIFTEIEELLELKDENVKRILGSGRGVKERKGDPLTFREGECQFRSPARQFPWIPQTLRSNKKGISLHANAVLTNKPPEHASWIIKRTPYAGRRS